MDSVNLKNARFFAKDDFAPLDAADVDCTRPAATTPRPTCTTSVKSGEILGQVLLSWHNVAASSRTT